MITGEGEKDFSRKIDVISHFGLSLYIVGKRSSAVCGSPQKEKSLLIFLMISVI